MQYPAILLPGIAIPADLTYRGLAQALAGCGTVLLRELAIYANGAPPQDYSLDMEVAALVEAADAAGFDRFHLGGYSAGGAISAAFAARHPDRLVSLALMEPAWFGNEGLSEEELAVRAAIDATTDLPYEESLAAFARLNVAGDIDLPPPPAGEPPPWMAHRPTGMRMIGPACNSHNLDPDALRDFPRPVLFMRGARSNPAVYRCMQDRAATLFANFSAEIFDERHHFDPPHRSEPERTARVLREFWDRAEAR